VTQGCALGYHIVAPSVLESAPDFETRCLRTFPVSEPQKPTCYGCGRELPEGVRFCVRCGKNNFDPDAARLAAAQCDMESGRRKTSIERFAYWWRFLTSGIRR
jgi:predicted amidophosphoribosyltransferase